MVVIEPATAVTAEVVEALGRLLPQLSTATAPPTEAELAEIIASPSARLLLARDRTGRIVGALTLVWYRIPYEKRGWIEDVVVDATARGQGIGERLTRAALRSAAEAGVRTVYLQTTPARAPANRLYHRLGFERREATLYRITLSPAEE